MTQMHDQPLSERTGLPDSLSTLPASLAVSGITLWKQPAVETVMGHERLF